MFTIAGIVLFATGLVAAGLLAARHRPEAVRADNAAGDSTCIACHQAQAGFEATAHHLTSRLPTRASILGSFSDGENVLRTANPLLYVRMDSTATGFYETAVMGRAPDTSIFSQRITYVTGVRKGQSYLSWLGDTLFQLPVSYWRGMGWANTPAYADGMTQLRAPIPPRCLECHASWFQSVPDPTVINRYQSNGVLLGITCETCHASGRDHVRSERFWLRRLLPRAIVNPARLPRARQMDGCALCHGGTAPLETAPFAYVPGRPLERRFSLSAPPDTGDIDAHGNQVTLLVRSRCFRSSQMTCVTCHDVHREQRDVVTLSERCLTCHTVQSCGLFPRQGQSLLGRCVDCHMPLLTSTTVVSDRLGHRLPLQVRTHWIKIYPQFQSP